MNVTSLQDKFSKSLANRRQRLSQAKVLSTTYRQGSISNVEGLSDLFTMSTDNPGINRLVASPNRDP
jgi:hypothetical protein